MFKIDLEDFDSAALRSEILNAAMQRLQDRFQCLGGALIDPETGRHPLVFVRRAGETKLFIKVTGSATYASEVERRMGVTRGTVAALEEAPPKERLVYLAHASEDKETLARPIAEGLLARGVDVWFDEWEIRAGQSLRQRMEKGLGDCTHFLVLLTENSVSKPWVNEERCCVRCWRQRTECVHGSAKWIAP
jgi:hypothetical protein